MSVSPPYVTVSFHVNSCDPVVILHVETQKVPFVAASNRVKVDNLSRGVYKVTARFGYSENKMNVMPVIHIAQKHHGLPEVISTNSHDPTEFSEKFQAAPITCFVDAFDTTVHCRLRFLSIIKYIPHIIYSLENKIFSGARRNIHVPLDQTLEIRTMIHLD